MRPSPPARVHRTTSLRLTQDGRELMRLRAVATLADLMILRTIRNECRAFMTHATEEISEDQQLLWWRTVAGRPDWRIWLVYIPEWPEAVGFGMLRGGQRGWTATLGFRPWMRGRGLGTLLYRMLADVAGAEVRAIIREDNLASQRAAVKAGYRRVPWHVPDQIALVGGEPHDEGGSF